MHMYNRRLPRNDHEAIIYVVINNPYLFHPVDVGTEPTHVVLEQVPLCRENHWEPGSESGGAVPQLLYIRRNM